MEEDGLHDGRIDEEGEDPHLTAAGRAEEREHLVDAREQPSPADAGGARRAVPVRSGRDRRRLCGVLG
jgi:hypothetical protein